jgi:predicted AlkP superfamily phosphohydrolase/phosphomutase
MASESRRVLIIGLDGVTLELIRPWVEEGILPTFKRLMQEGAWGPLRSVMPPVTPAAWSSFITGANPGKHGIYDFTSRQEGYEFGLVNSTLRQAPSLWGLASQAGKRVIVYNVPVTYPPERVNGLMVSGLMTPPSAKDATYPPELQQELSEAIPGFAVAGHAIFRPAQQAELVREVLAIHDQNLRAARYLLHRQPWDLFVAEFQHSDTISHIMWKHMEDKGEGLPESVREIAANAIRDCYRDLDAKVGELIEEAGEGTHVIVMSDHGHGRLKYVFSMNTWLFQKGYIHLKRDFRTQFKYLLYRMGFTPALGFRLLHALRVAGRMQAFGGPAKGTIKERLKELLLSDQDIDWMRTRAYSAGYGSPIFVNLKGRQPEGSVEPGKEYDAVVDQLIADLNSVKEPGSDSPLFSEFHRRDEIFSGPLVNRAPDLVVLAKNPEFHTAGWKEFDEDPWQSSLGDAQSPLRWMYQMRVPYTGNHRLDGILFFMGPGIKTRLELAGASIMDIAPTALALLGVPVPNEMDGRVLEAAMLPELRDRLNVDFTSDEGLRPDLTPVAELSAEDEQILIARLQNLGYIG